MINVRLAGISDFGCSISDVRFRNFGFRMFDFGITDFGCSISEFRISDVQFRNFGFRMFDFGFAEKN
jgi:hypothetical protein